jgi:hypothetical protein
MRMIDAECRSLFEARRKDDREPVHQADALVGTEVCTYRSPRATIRIRGTHATSRHSSSTVGTVPVSRGKSVYGTGLVSTWYW